MCSCSATAWTNKAPALLQSMKKEAVSSSCSRVARRPASGGKKSSVCERFASGGLRRFLVHLHWVWGYGRAILPGCSLLIDVSDPMVLALSSQFLCWGSLP
ncbi:hypothetical protein F3Y22_tig00014064pilonHSYRG00104 [Hibiscus syriacus]|uniref:Uncharacterized protein n=1 Tax=Hibiscus syriacus TaxID=106335 RepID=A0A6A3C011_HIBSY|nr:hypothetical protein F3Y22_tig00014064pilonHSYRG00104 [Hibiscus syriacus]